MKDKGVSGKMLVIVSVYFATIVVGACLVFLCHRDFKRNVISQTQQDLLMIATTAAMNLENFIADRCKILKTIAMNPSCQTQVCKKMRQTIPDSDPCLIKILYEIHKRDTDALTLVDANGIMLHRHPFIADRPGMDHTDKPGVAYVIREHKQYVSGVFYNNLGNPAISISEPVFYESTFVGMVRWMIQVDTIARRFVQPIKIGAQGRAVLLDSKGRFLYHPKRTFGTCTCYDDLAKNKRNFPDADWSSLNTIIAKRFKGEKGVGVVYDVIPGEPEEGEKITKKIAAYCPACIGVREWSITVDIPYNEIAGPIGEHARRTFALAGLFALLFGTGSIAFFITQQKKRQLAVESQHLRVIARSQEELQKVYEELENKNKELSMLSQRLLFVQEWDRQQLSMELHDQIGQMLTIVKMDVGMVGKSIAPDNIVLKKKMKHIEGTLTQAIREVKNICHRLRPSTLDTMGLIPSLKMLIEDVRRRGAFYIEFYDNDITQRFNPDIEIALYRIVQESLTNIIKYANAQRVFISLILRESLLSLSIEDDGVGFDVDQIVRKGDGTGLGLLTMKERVEQLQGNFIIESRPGYGTHIIAEIPIAKYAD